MTTKSKVFDWAEKHGVHISEELGSHGTHHVHADIEAPGTIFRAHDLHNLGLWDGDKRPQWNKVMQELIEADIGPCEIEGCDCNEC